MSEAGCYHVVVVTSGLKGGGVRVDGRCHCGNIRYQAEVDPGKVNVCHCTDCQMLTGSAFRANVQAPRESLEALHLLHERR